MLCKSGWRWLAPLLQVLLGLAFIGGLWLLLARSYAIAEVQHIPTGWRIFRPPAEVCCLARFGRDIWCGGKDGLTIIDGVTGEVQPVSQGQPHFGYVRALHVDRRQAVWVAHDGGLASYSDGGWHDYSGGLYPAKRALSLMEDHQDRLWIGSERRTTIYDEGAFHRVPFPRDISLASADVIFEDKAGVVWIGCASPTYGGLCSYRDGQWKQYSVREGLPHPAVNMIIEDAQGATWVATGFANRGGALRIHNGRWSTLTKRDGLAGWKVRSVFEDREGRLWFGSEYDGVAILSQGSWRVIPPDAGLAGNEVKAIIQDEDGKFWLGTERGLSCIPKL